MPHPLSATLSEEKEREREREREAFKLRCGGQS